VKKSQYYALQLGEPTDVANLAVLLIFVRYSNEDTGIAEEELLFCRPLKERITGIDIYNLTNAYFAENEIDWPRCIGICTDGATSMTGKHAGFVCSSDERDSNKRLLDSVVSIDKPSHQNVCLRD
jgi:hypothetical protein